MGEEEEEEAQGFQPDEEVQPEPEVVTRKRKPPVAESVVELEKPEKTPRQSKVQPADKNDDRTKDGDLKDDDKKVPPIRTMV